MLVYKLDAMDKMPESCKDCKAYFCSLPLKRGKPEIKKEYLTKRHKNCPLMEVEHENT